uniref:Uncharacterized protein n=1 Tax=Rhizophora mucronata TaxID=61149 RepID=A0A2P2ITN5_RHIMU
MEFPFRSRTNVGNPHLVILFLH